MAATAWGAASPVWVLAVAAWAAVGCNALKEIDVCDRGQGTELQVNLRTEGDQRLENTRSIVALPPGGALVVFASLDDAAATSSEVRAANLSGDGVALRTCDDASDTTWVPIDPTGPTSQLRQRPTLGRPLGGDQYGLLAYDATVDGSQELQVFVQAFDATTGCLSGDALQLSDEPQGTTAAWLQVVPTAVRQFTVIWATTTVEADDTTSPAPAIRARAVGIPPGLPIQTLPTALSKTGDPADLVSNVYYSVVAAGERGDGGVLLAWIELAVGENRVHLTSYDDALRVTGDVLVSTAAMTSLPDEVGIDVASDGNQALVAWIERDTTAAETPRVWGRYFTPVDLASLRAPEAPNGEQFRLGSSTASTDEGYPSLAVVPGGGLVALWSETGDPTRADTSGASVRALLLGPDGGRVFANLACGNSDFQLNIGARNDQLEPNGVVLADGTLLGVWTDLGQNGTDRFTDNSGAGIRALALPPRLLRPIP